MKNTIERKIAGIELPKRDREIVDYILKNKKHACFMTAAEIADTLDVSASSVVRLSKKLGYENFATFKRALQEEVAESGNTAARETIPYEKIKEYEDLSDADALAAFSRNAIANIKADISPEMDGKIIEIADMTVRARSVYIVGFRSCYGFASTMGVKLACMRPGVTVIGHNIPMADSLVDLSPDDLMIAISFARYSSDTALAAEIARDAGCPVVAITDSYAAPIAKGAAQIIVNSVGNMSFFDSYVSVTMNTEKILLLVSKRNKKINEERAMRMEGYLRRTGQY